MTDTPTPQTVTSDSGIPPADPAADAKLIPVAPPQQKESDMQMYWRRFNEVLDMSAFEPAHNWVDQQNNGLAQIVQDESDANHPWRAGVAKAYLLAQKDVTDALFGLSTPKNALLALAAPEAGPIRKIVRAVQFAYNGYFAWRGAQQILEPRAPNEDMADYVNRIGMSTVQTGLAGTGALQMAGDSIHEFVQKNLGLKGDLAKRVSAKIARVGAVTAKGEAGVAAVETAADEGQKGIIKKELPKSTAQVISDARQALVIEQARAEAHYEDAAREAKKPLTSTGDLRTEIVNTVTAHGVQDKEIPSRVFSALPQDTTKVRALTASESKAAILAKNLTDQGLPNRDVRSAIVNLGYVPSQVDAIMTSAGVAQSTDVSILDAVRVKGDLYAASMAATDPQLRAGLAEAAQNVDGMVQRYFDDLGKGKKWAAANQQYAQFKHDMGSSMMADFLAASDRNERAALPKALEIGVSDPTDLKQAARTEALRGLLAEAGIDVSPIDELLARHKDIAETRKQAIADIEKGTKDSVKKIGSSNAIIPGKSDLKLAGKTTTEIRQDAIGQIISRSRKAGIANPSAYIQTMSGSARLAAGSSFGLFGAVSGATRLTIEAMLRNKRFQDWIISESGVESDAIPAVRKAIRSSGPWMEKLAETDTALLHASVAKLSETTAPARTLDSTVQQQKNQVRTITPQPTQPIRPPQGNIRIAP